MTNEEIVILEIEKRLSFLSIDEKESCIYMAEHIRRMVKTCGYTVGGLAVALVAAELLLENP